MALTEDIRNFVSEAVKDLDTNLKAAGYDMLRTDKGSATETIERIRRKVKVLEAKSTTLLEHVDDKVADLEGKLKQRAKREYRLEKENQELKTEVKRLKACIDDDFPDYSDTSFSFSQDQSETDKPKDKEKTASFSLSQDQPEADKPKDKEKTDMKQK